MALKPSDASGKVDFKFATNIPTTAHTTSLISNPSTMMNNHNNIRPFSEPPPYGSSTLMNSTVSRTTPTYAPHISSSTINKFTRPVGNDHQLPLKATPNNIGKPYVPLGEIRRNNHVQNRPAQPTAANATPSSYHSLAAFTNLPIASHAGLRNLPTHKEEDDGEPASNQSEEELSELTPSVLAKRLAESQAKLTAQGSELKGINVIHYSLYIHKSLQVHIFIF